jgi:hypothetical protein
VTIDGKDTPELVEDDDVEDDVEDDGVPTAETTAARVRNMGIVEDTLALNEKMANLPREIEINDKTIYVQSKTIREVIRTDRAVFELQILINSEVFSREDLVTLRSDPDFAVKVMEATEARQLEVWNLVRKCVVMVANGPDTKDDDKLTVKDVDDMTLAEANLVCQSYLQYNDVDELLKNVQGVRSF